MSKLPLLLLGILLGACGVLRGQSVDLTTDHFPMAPLPALWRFHAGDDPTWAKPEFDDSGWSLLKSDTDWYTQGYKGYSGMGWYRFRLVLPSSIQHSSISLPDIYTSFEIFADGVKIGTFGKMPPHGAIFSNGTDNILYNIPPSRNSASNSKRTVTIAIRVWMWPAAAGFRGGGPDFGSGLAGDSAQIRNQRDLVLAQSHWEATSDQVTAVLQLFAALISISLFLTRPKEQEYLWFGLKSLCAAIVAWIFLSMISHVWQILILFATLSALFAATSLCYIIFFLKLLRPRHTWLLWLAVLSIIVRLMLQFQNAHFPDLMNVTAFGITEAVLELPRYIWTLSVVVITAMRAKELGSQRTDARLLLLPVSLQIALNFYNDAQRVSWYLALNLHFLDFTRPFTQQPFPISFDGITQPLFLLSVFAILILRFSRTRSEQERYATEFEGARSVQQFLIPDHLPNTPGLRIESEYRPAREVGGDFFQVLPDAADGSVLIVVGDVAGHGMESGMLATLIVGAIRTAAEFTSEPGRILSLLNKRMQGRGLATCLALRIERDGSAALANAGHLPPYLNGLELPMEGALPLGAVLGIDFPVLHFKLADGDGLMLMTDGVAEAQDHEGHLFGFERIAEMLRNGMAAAALATAAQAFGQEDDITVLTVARLAPAMIG